MLIDGKSFFDMQMKNYEETYEQMIEMGRNNDYTTGNLLDSQYFSKHYKLIAIDLNKQIELENPDLKQQINFIGRLERNERATMFFIIKKSEETTLNLCIKMEIQKIGNLLQDITTDKFETKVIKSNLCDYSDAYILVTGDITATGGDANTRVAFKNCAPFTKCITHINDEHVDNIDNFDIIMAMYNLIEYSDNYSDTSGSLWQFKRDESPVTNAGNPDNNSVDNSTSFKYKSSSIGESTTVDGNRVFKNVKIAVPLKYLSNFWISLEMPFINCKIHFEFNWSRDCVMSTIADTTFKITLYEV